jgi:16S rRNA (uracil1498-N3)-methyltransferase
VPPPEALRAAAALVYASDLETPLISPNDSHHLVRVLRVGTGETIAVSDGAGAFRIFEVVGVSRDEGALEVEARGAVQRAERGSGGVSVGFALVKQDRSEWAIGKLVELGVDRIMPMICERSVVRPEAGPRVERLSRIVVESAMQARRAFLPTLDPPRRFGEVVAGLGLSGAVALAEPGGPPLGPRLASPLASPLGPAIDTVLVGPEGGWSETELACGLPTVGLGDTVLRTETAAVAAAVLLMNRR